MFSHKRSLWSLRHSHSRPLLYALSIAILLTLIISALPGQRRAGAQSANLALGRPASASSSENSGTGPGLAFDGNTGTRWSSAFSDPQWLRVDLGSTRSINRVLLRWEAAYGRSYQVQTSNDGSAWSTIYSTTSGNGAIDDLTGLSGSGRYVRVYGTARATGYGYSLWEFEVYGPTTTATATRTRTNTTGSGPTATRTRTNTTGSGPTATRPPTLPTRVPTASGTVGGHGEFVAVCPFSHRLADDSIVLPNQPGASHFHDFMGATTSNAFSTEYTLFAGGSNCSPQIDKTSYWVPTLYRSNGTPVNIIDGTFYYMSTHTNNPRAIQPFPFGLRMIAGNSKATGPQSPAYAEWFCLGAPGHSFDGPVYCPAGSKLQVLLGFPSCWNGRDLDSPDHKSHMAYSVAGVCPSTHPVIVPRVEQKLTYDSIGEAGMYLSSGPAQKGALYSFHGDFFNAWDPAELERRVRNCSQILVKCDVNGNRIG